MLQLCSLPGVWLLLGRPWKVSYHNTEKNCRTWPSQWKCYETTTALPMKHYSKGGKLIATLTVTAWKFLERWVLMKIHFFYSLKKKRFAKTSPALSEKWASEAAHGFPFSQGFHKQRRFLRWFCLQPMMHFMNSTISRSWTMPFATNMWHQWYLKQYVTQYHNISHS